MPNLAALDESQKKRFRCMYCGLCKVLRDRHGLKGCSTLSYDLTFLAILLSALYEQKQSIGKERCLPHPINSHAFIWSEAFEYAADMNIALAYHKCLDNWHDEHSIVGRSEAALLTSSYNKVKHLYPVQCSAIENWICEIHTIEQTPNNDIDAPVNSTGRMLGILFRYKEDFWSDTLQRIGDGLGRFIYFMDAFDDLQSDIKHGRFNPLKSIQDKENFNAICKDLMTMMVADSTSAFEDLPIVQDVDLLRNVLYSGIWSRYMQIIRKQTEVKGAK